MLAVGLTSQAGMLSHKLLCSGLVPGLHNPSVTLFPGRIREARHCSLRTQCCTQLHSPVSDPARVAVGAFAIDVIAGVAILAGRTELLAALSVEARQAGLVTLGAIPARLTRQAAPIGHGARLQALALPTPTRRRTHHPAHPKSSCCHLSLVPDQSQQGWPLTASCSLGRRSRLGTARGSTCPGSLARKCRSRPPGCTCPCSTGSSGHSEARRSSPGTGSAP